MPTTEASTNGHAVSTGRPLRAAADTTRERSTKRRDLHPEDAERVAVIAQRLGMTIADTIATALDLLERATADERHESAAERRARIAAKFEGRS